MRSIAAFTEGRTGAQREQDDFARKARGHRNARLLFSEPLAEEAKKAPAAQSIAPPRGPAMPTADVVAAVKIATAPLRAALAEIGKGTAQQAAPPPPQPTMTLTVRHRGPPISRPVR